STEGVGIVQVSVLVGDHNTGDALQAEGLIAQGSVALTVAKGGGVVDGGHQDGTEQDLGHDLTGGGNAQGAGGDVLGDAALLAHSGGLHLPVGAGELTVLVVTQSTQDHGQSLIPGDGVIGAEGTGVIALDVLGVGAEVDVAGVPRG